MNKGVRALIEPVQARRGGHPNLPPPIVGNGRDGIACQRAGLPGLVAVLPHPLPVQVKAEQALIPEPHPQPVPVVGVVRFEGIPPHVLLVAGLSGEVNDRFLPGVEPVEVALVRFDPYIALRVGE